MKVQIKSRYGNIRTIEKGCIIYGDSHYMRFIGDDTLEAIDFEGGPYISVGMDISYFSKELKGIIDKIEPVSKEGEVNCYFLSIKDED